MFRYFVAALTVTALAACRQAATAPGSLIANVVLYDGSGEPGRPTSVRIAGDTIVAVGELEPGRGETVVDGRGLVLAPGFIDTHSHADAAIFSHRDALAAVSQGITTVVVGQDGGSPSPLADFFRRLDSTPPAVNVASYSGHATLRLAVMGQDDYRRAATTAETDRIRELLESDLAAGSLGLSTGLEYDEGHSATTEEVLTLAKAAGAAGGRYISHIRSEDRAFWPAIDEIIRIGREAKLPVQISHLKLAMRSLWGMADSLLGVLDAARTEGVDITADIYPYTFWQSTLRVLFPERNYRDPAAARFALTEVTTPEGILMSRWTIDSSYVGQTLAQIAMRRGTDPTTTLIDMIRESQAADSLAEARAGDQSHAAEVESIIATSMAEPDVEKLLRWSHANVCTDGELDGRHPRGFGAFAKVLGPYVRDRKLFPPEEAVRKMTSLPARNAGIENRGTIRPGAAADLVLFDPATVADRSTPTEPQRPAIGVAMVWVNGQLVFRDGKPTGRYSGRAVRRGEAR